MTAAAWESAMSLVKPEHLLADLLGGPEYDADPIVRAHLQAWRRAEVGAADCLLNLVRDLSRTRRSVVDHAVELAMRRPFHLLHPTGPTA